MGQPGEGERKATAYEADSSSPSKKDNEERPASDSSQPAAAKKPVKKRGKPRLHRKKKARDMPRRPLSGYNYFFREERTRWLAERQDNEIESGGDLFSAMGRTIGERWKRLPPEEAEKYKAMAASDMDRYRRDMDHYHAEAARKARLEASEVTGDQSPSKAVAVSIVSAHPVSYKTQLKPAPPSSTPPAATAGVPILNSVLQQPSLPLQGHSPAALYAAASGSGGAQQGVRNSHGSGFACLASSSLQDAPSDLYQYLLLQQVLAAGGMGAHARQQQQLSFYPGGISDPQQQQLLFQQLNATTSAPPDLFSTRAIGGGSTAASLQALLFQQQKKKQQQEQLLTVNNAVFPNILGNTAASIGNAEAFSEFLALQQQQHLPNVQSFLSDQSSGGRGGPGSTFSSLRAAQLLDSYRKRATADTLGGLTQQQLTSLLGRGGRGLDISSRSGGAGANNMAPAHSVTASSSTTPNDFGQDGLLGSASGTSINNPHPPTVAAPPTASGVGVGTTSISAAGVDSEWVLHQQMQLQQQQHQNQGFK